MALVFLGHLFHIGGMFTKTTNQIKVTVYPVYLEDQSLPEDNHFVWAYTVQLENHGEQTVQLMRRYWHITDANGQVQEVTGEGVVGEKPVLEPGEAFRYTSGTALATPSGVMVGNYEMVIPGSNGFTIDIPAFSLDSPYQLRRLN